MPKLFTSIKLQLLRLKRKKRLFGQNFNWRVLILPGLVLLGSSLIALATPYSFTTLATPLPASNCYIQENIDRTQLLLIWTDNSDNEDFYEVQRSVDGGTWTTLQTALAPNTINLLDSSISNGHTYQY